ncbi:MAG: hypothetical protein CBC29_01675 [Methylococcaceae bacterium TMED69]|nr:MAG: hypothetical protein CBC29_01675 [Methylococcaceae bacterium TMED69]|tara:strand:+ start:216 stop:1223 length:1008 start_codon:yes stop_codon:yes gene_type:complete
MRLAKSKSLYISSVLLLLAVLPLWAIFLCLTSPSVQNSVDSYEIHRGQSIVKVASDLNDLKVLDNIFLTRFFFKMFNFEGKVKAGIYEFDAGDSRWEVMKKITEGEQKLLAITFIEGSTFAQIKETIQNSNFLNEDVLDHNLISNTFGYDINAIEGLFFPDTYLYKSDTKSSEILLLASKKMGSILKAEWEKKSDEIDDVIKTPYDALILASIVEKEAVLDVEKPIIAGVFIKRLIKNMRLQSDPTVIYAMGDAYKGNIKRSDLKINSPFNTYRQKGLPPTPIGAPGLKSLRAVLNPRLSDYLYFVSKNDGSHKFSKTLKEHNDAVNYYQRKVRK